jgi:outer membrane protein TolC
MVRSLFDGGPRCAAALVLVSAAAAQTPHPLTLDDCIRMALAAPSAVTLARQEAAIASAGVGMARAGLLPQARIGSGLVYNSPSPTAPDQFSFIALNAFREYTAQFMASEEFDTSGRLRAALARARADREATAAGLAVTTRDLRRAVTTAYYQLLLARRLVQVNRDSLEEARDFEKRTRLLSQNGEAAEADVVKAAAQVAFLDQSQRAAELDAAVAAHQLASFWTESAGDALDIEDVLDRPAPPPEEAPAAAGEPFLKRPEFLALDAQRRGFLADARQARAQLLPQLSATFEYGIDAERVSIRERGYAAFVNLNIPVWDWFRARDDERRSRLRANEAATNRAIAARTFSKEYQDALARVRSIYEQIALTASQVDLSERNLKLSRLRYEGGEGPALDVVAAVAQLTQARANHFAAIAAYWNGRADLEVASGK